ncbi:MAG TPA: hypothetical protein VKA01_09515 [Vicinamibacteria bacterium]|nr:hypothetical protein [Vicinamibacteria bacterium]
MLVPSTRRLAQKSVAPLALALFALFPPLSPASDAVDLSGRFRLNEAESEDARQKMRQAMEGRRTGSGMGGSRQGRPPGGPGGSGRRPAPEGGGGRPEGLLSLFQAPKAITLTHTFAEIAVLEDDGRLRTLHPDGKTYKAEGGSVDVKSRWDGALLVVESKTANGPKVTETWSLDAVSGKLTIDTAVEAPGREGVKVRRVYDREPASAS